MSLSPIVPRLMLESAKRGLVLLGVAVLAVIGALAAQAAPASAATGDILVSLDGVAYSTALPTGLFDGIGTVIPRQVVTRPLWVRNNTTEAVVFRLSRAVTALGSPLAFSISATSTAAVAPGPAEAVNPGCPPILPDLALAAGGVARIAVTIVVADLDGSEVQNFATPVDLLALSRTPGPTVGIAPCVGSVVPSAPATPVTPTRPVTKVSLAFTGDGSLAFTGDRMFYPALMIASTLVGVGAFALLAARRRRRRA